MGYKYDPILDQYKIISSFELCLHIVECLISELILAVTQKS